MQNRWYPLPPKIGFPFLPRWNTGAPCPRALDGSISGCVLNRPVACTSR